MTMTREQAAEIHAEVIETVKQLIYCLDENQTPTLVGEMALVMLAGTSAGAVGRPLEDILIPTLKIGWDTANENTKRRMN